MNSGTSTLTADSCAGCHRAHTAQSEYLLAAASEELLCLSCHGNNGTLATVNVEAGLQYVPSGTGTRTVTVLGALRNGGFLQARIDSSDPSRLAYIRGYEDSPFNTVFAISAKPKVGVLGAVNGTPVDVDLMNVNSAHIDLSPSAGDGIADTGTVWGKGATGLGTPLVELTCVECHNPHGNGNFRILRPVPGVEADPLGQPEPVDVKATYTNFDTIVTDGQHGLVVGDKVTLANVGGLANGDYYVAVVTNGFTFKVASSLALIGTVLNVTDTTAAGTVTRPEVPIADVNPDPDGDGSYPTKNYTVIQTKGSQGVDSTYLLYARDVLAARGGTGVAADQLPVTIDQVFDSGEWLETPDGVAHGLAVGDLVDLDGSYGLSADPYTVASVGASTGSAVYDRFTLVGVTFAANNTADGTVVRKGIPGDYSATGGDYFRRIVPWDASLVNPSCSNITFSTTNSAYCGTANDAPNGRPGTITSGPSALIGQQAFLDQMSTWCSQCHTRYYSASNENVAGDPIISSQSDLPIGGTAATDMLQSDIYSGSTRYGSPAYGDRVTFAGTGTGLDSNPAGGWWVIYTGSSSTFQVSSTKAGAAFDILADFAPGTFTKVYQSSNSSWGYPREDNTYKYQHSTASNRACTVCHVSHGSNAEMIGPDSLAVPYPDGTTTSTSSRLLKVDNRGTCQMCHDPTGTVAEGTYLPTVGYSTTVP